MHFVHAIWSRCEVQFDYGLRQKRYKKLEDRPTSFVTAEGKTINVVQNTAAQNDRTVTRGKVGRTLMVPGNIPDLEIVRAQSPRAGSAARRCSCPSDHAGGAVGFEVPFGVSASTQISTQHIPQIGQYALFIADPNEARLLRE